MTAARALEIIATAYRDPAGVAARLRDEGHRVLRIIGSDAPLPLLRAAGFSPVRMAPQPGTATPRADALLGVSSGRRRPHHLVEQLLDPAMIDPVLFTRADAEQAQIFSALRENTRLGVSGPQVVTLLDLLHIDRPSSRAYNGRRLSQLRDWLVQAGGHDFTDADLAAAADAADAVNDLLRAADRLRVHARLSGTAMLHLVGCAAILPPGDMVTLIQDVIQDATSLPLRTGTPILCAGSAQETDLHAVAIEAEGFHIVGESHEWGVTRLRGHTPRAFTDWSDPTFAVPTAAANSARLAAVASEAAHDRQATTILHLSIDMDEAAPWHIAALHAQPIPVQTSGSALDSADSLRQSLRGGQSSPRLVRPQPTAQRPKARSRKLLTASASSGDYQRDWFASVRAQIAAGAPFAMVNANAPQEILRALDIPFVVNQWWASIVAAKQQSARYRGLLEAHHYPANVEAYSAQGVAAAFDEDVEQAPWGGLPRPDFVHAIASSDATPGIFEAWARESDATPMLYERTVDPRWQIDTNWWEILPDRWDEALEPERLDLLVAELRDVIATIEAQTGHHFDEDRFIEVMNLVNEQEDYYRKTRDLIARTIPAPIGIVDSMPATMVPQWHRGTVWGRDAAKALHDEVAARVDAGQTAVPEEKVRLMWVGRGLWSNTGFYQKWEESHGAIFVWSMYLALAADGYIRNFDRGRDPMRALAARFLTMGDELRMPSWAAPWHVHEAQTHSIDGAVALSDADPFVLRALVAAGIPVLELGVDNYALDRADADDLESRIAAFITGPCMQQAAQRKTKA